MLGHFIGLYMFFTKIILYNVTEISLFELLNNTIESLAHELNVPFVASLTHETHILPDFHGNRCSVYSPYTDVDCEFLMSCF